MLNKKCLYMLSAGHLSVDINTGSFPAVLPFFVTFYGMDYTSIAGLVFASSCLSSVIQPLFGYLADKGSRQWFMALGVIMSGVSLAITGFVTDYWSIFIATMAMGIGAAIFHPEGARNVNAIAGAQKGQALSIFSLGGNGGFGFGPLLAVFLITTFGMHGLLFYGITAIIMSILLIISVPYIRRTAMATVAKTSTDKIAKVNDKLSAASNDWPAFTKLFIVILFRSTTFTAITSFLPLFCIQVLGVSHTIGNATLSIISILAIIATLVGGKFADQHGYVQTLRYGCFLLVPCLAVVAFTHSIYAVYAMLLPMSFAMMGPYSAFVALGQTYLAKSIGFASGITLGLSFSIGGMIVPSIGWFADNYGLEYVMILIFIISLGCAIATLFLPQPKKANM